MGFVGLWCFLVSRVLWLTITPLLCLVFCLWIVVWCEPWGFSLFGSVVSLQWEDFWLWCLLLLVWFVVHAWCFVFRFRMFIYQSFFEVLGDGIALDFVLVVVWFWWLGYGSFACLELRFGGWRVVDATGVLWASVVWFGLLGLVGFLCSFVWWFCVALNYII